VATVPARISGFVVIAGAFAAGAAIAGPLAGAIAAAAILIALLAITYIVASRRAEHDFLRGYAATRRLAWTAGRDWVAPISPLLRRGNDRYFEHAFRGLLPGGVEGKLARYTYVERTSEGSGNQHRPYHRFTVVLTSAPGTAARIQELLCWRRSGLRVLDSAEDVLRTHQRVELESDAADRRYEIFIGELDDPVWARRLFEPSFVVWLAAQAPESFAFEFSGGTLVTSVTGHRAKALELDALCEATAIVVRRLEEEAAGRGP